MLPPAVRAPIKTSFVFGFLPLSHLTPGGSTSLHISLLHCHRIDSAPVLSQLLGETTDGGINQCIDEMGVY